jgi:NAD-dependent SIR2 family protein deacetylase
VEGGARHIVLFLGAGASRPLGFPVTAEILPQILRTLGERGDAGRELGRLLQGFLPGLFAPGVEPPLITDLLSLVDQFVASGTALHAGLGPRGVARLRVLLEDAIAEALEEPSVPPAAEAASVRERLVSWMVSLAEDPASRLTVITTNYDLAFEERLYESLGRQEIPELIDFGLRWRNVAGPEEPAPPPPRPCLEVFKLHGSLDWLHCDLCEHVTIDTAGIADAPQAGGRCACGYAPLRRLIVAPSMVRDLRNANLQTVWQAALEALRSAGHWTLVGYSLPPEDLAIRVLLMRAYRARPRPPAVTVVDRGRQPEVEARYRLLFPDLRYVQGGVEEFVGTLDRPRAADKAPA